MKKVPLNTKYQDGLSGFDIEHSFLTYKKEASRLGYRVGKISNKEKHITFHKIDGDE